MNKKVKEAIYKVYIEKDYKFFKDMCYSMPSYLELLENTISKYSKEYEIYKIKGEPEITFYINYDNYNYDKFSIEYSTILNISKICNVYYIQHEFSIDNINPNKIMNTLDNFSDKPYNLKQFKMEKEIIEILSNLNLERIYLNDLDEVVNLCLPQESEHFFGKQITVHELLFNDLYYICENNL